MDNFAAFRKPELSLAAVIRSSLLAVPVRTTLSWLELYAAVTPALALLIRLMIEVRVSVSLLMEMETPLIVNDPVVTLALRYSVPRWMVSRWWRRLGSHETRSLLSSFSRPAPLALWVHPGRSDPERLAAELAGQRLPTRRTQAPQAAPVGAHKEEPFILWRQRRELPD